MSSRRRRAFAVVVVAAVVAAGGFAAWYFLLRQPELPSGFASGNGRLEATEFDVSTKLAGRLATVLAKEGDNVRAGQVVAQIDDADLQAALREAQAQLERAVAGEQQARAQVRQLESEYRLAQKTLQRTRAVLAKGLISRETADQHETRMQSAAAALEAGKVGITQAQAAVAAARAAVQRIQVNIGDCTLVAPVSGRVLYKLAEAGEVLAAGGKVLTLIDLSDVYMPIFLPTEQAGRVRLGAPARIVFDALPDVSVPAVVSFVAPQAQFTPKEVETRTEREKLMFRVKVRIDRELLLEHLDLVKTGVPGVAYVRLDPAAVWPAWLPAPVQAGKAAAETH